MATDYAISCGKLTTDLHKYEESVEQLKFATIASKLDALCLAVRGQKLEFNQLQDRSPPQYDHIKYMGKDSARETVANALRSVGRILKMQLSFSKRKIEILKEYSQKPYSKGQKQIFQSKLSELDDQMRFYNEAIIYQSSMKQLSAATEETCIIL